MRVYQRKKKKKTIYNIYICIIFLLLLNIIICIYFSLFLYFSKFTLRYSLFVIVLYIFSYSVNFFRNHFFSANNNNNDNRLYHFFRSPYQFQFFLVSYRTTFLLMNGTQSLKLQKDFSFCSVLFKFKRNFVNVKYLHIFSFFFYVLVIGIRSFFPSLNRT